MEDVLRAVYINFPLNLVLVFILPDKIIFIAHFDYIGLIVSEINIEADRFLHELGFL